jgi:UPF0271 protein
MDIKVDLNSDVGESFGVYKMGLDEEIMKYISSANIACGFHAGGPSWMRTTVDIAEQNQVGIGAHPSYPDIEGFGRRDMSVSPDEVMNDLTYQIGALQAFTKSKKLQHVKLHGALYNRAVHDEELATSICRTILDIDSNMILIVPSGSKWAKIGKQMGVRIARETFADRSVNPDGSLVSRSIPGSVIHNIDEVVNRSVEMITEQKVRSFSGEKVDIKTDSLCVHGDTPGAAEMVKVIRKELNSAGIHVVHLNLIV